MKNWYFQKEVHFSHLIGTYYTYSLYIDNSYFYNYNNLVDLYKDIKGLTKIGIIKNS